MLIESSGPTAAGWSEFFSLARDAGFGIAIVGLIYRIGGPWVARTLERQQERLTLADEAEIERRKRAEDEVDRLRERELELVEQLGAARLEAERAARLAEEAGTALRETRAAAQVAEQDRDAARVDLEALRQRLAACQAESGRLRAELERRG